MVIPAHGVPYLSDKLNEKLSSLIAMMKSKKYRDFISNLDSSIAEQEIAHKDVNAALKNAGVAVPEGVSFSLQAHKLRLTIEISTEPPVVS